MPRRIRLLIETDVFGDVDDVGALAVAHRYADDDAAEIIGVGVNTCSRYGYQTVRIVNRWYGRTEIPVGVRLPLDDSVFSQDYAKQVVDKFGIDEDAKAPEAAVAVHRRALAAAVDGSVTVVSLGFLSNLGDLLSSPPDEVSDLAGRELIRRKVVRFVVMAGRFPSGHEYNITEDIPSAARVIADWPGPIDFLGWEAGAHVVTGKSISMGRGVIASAYRAYNGAGTGRESWDLLAMHVALTDDSSLYGFSEPGLVDVDPTGRTQFHPDPAGTHRYVLLAADPQAVADVLDIILDTPPAMSHPTFSNVQDQ